MKAILKLIFLGLVIAFAYNIYEKHQDAWRPLLAEAKELLKDFRVEPGAGTIAYTEASTGENSSNAVDITDYSVHESARPDSYISSENENTAYHETSLEYHPGESPAGSESWIKTVTEKYSPDSWQMLMLYDRLPASSAGASRDGGTISSDKSADAFHYLEGGTRIELLASMATNVHEISHAYFSQNVFQHARENGLKLDWDLVQGFLYLSPGESFFLSFPKQSLFPSNELVSFIPISLRTFRFDTYVAGNTSTQGQGVIGLLDELHAYYLGSKFHVDVSEAYKESAGSDAEGLFAWVSATQSEMTAFYEFDFFIREYLLLMKRNHSSDYAKLKEYEPFTDAYKAVCSSFEGLTGKYTGMVQTELEKLNASGEGKAWIKDGHFWVRNADGSSSGTPLFSEDREKLLPVLQSERYNDIKADFLGK